MTHEIPDNLIYNYQTLITGLIAIAVTIVTGFFLWKQVGDTRLMTKISYREILQDILSKNLLLFSKIETTLQPKLEEALRLTIGSDGEYHEINEHIAHGLHTSLQRNLDWYLVDLADTESQKIEICKAKLRCHLTALDATLTAAYRPASELQSDEYHSYSDEEWGKIKLEGIKAKKESAEKVIAVYGAYEALKASQADYVRSLRKKLSRVEISLSEKSGN